jgi:hypothetical protein
MHRAGYCVGPERSNDERYEALLDDLDAQITGIKSQLKVPQETCHSVQAFVAKMLRAAMALKMVGERLKTGISAHPAQRVTAASEAQEQERVH